MPRTASGDRQSGQVMLLVYKNGVAAGGVIVTAQCCPHWTSLLALLLATFANAQDTSYPDGRGNNIYFPLGARSLADDVIDYQVGTPSPSGDALNPLSGAGAPDEAGVTLGCGGSAVFVFVDNAMMDVKGMNLFVFEVGPDVEATAVDISSDGVTWLAAATVGGSTSSLDVEALTTAEDMFQCVRLTDLETACRNGAYPGADINAVGAIGSVATVPPGEDCEPDETVIDEVTAFNKSCLIEISDPARPAPTLFGEVELQKAGTLFDTLQRRYAEADRMGRRAVVAEARDLAASLAAAVRTRASEDEDPDMTMRVQRLADTVSQFVAEKTPALVRPFGPSAYADAFFPAFPSGAPAGGLVEQWKQQVSLLAQHEGRLNDLRGWRAVSAWRDEKNQLLLQLMLAEEDLVWGVVTTPYTEDEMRMLQQPFANIAAAKERFAAIAASDPELARLYALLEQYSTGLTIAEEALKQADQRYLSLLAAASEGCVRAKRTLPDQASAASMALRRSVARPSIIRRTSLRIA